MWLCPAMCQVKATLTCGVNACVSTYLCLCSHLCRPCRRISAEPVEADVTGLTVRSCWWTGLEVVAAATLQRDVRWHQLHPGVRLNLCPATKMRAGFVEGGLAQPVATHCPACSPEKVPRTTLVPPERTSVVPLSPEQNNSGAVTNILSQHPAAGWALIAAAGMSTGGI